MGQVLRTAKFSHEPIKQPPGFTARQIAVCRMIGVSDSTVRRWQTAGQLWAYDPEHPDGHYIQLASGRKRYNLDRVWSAIVGPL